MMRARKFTVGLALFGLLVAAPAFASSICAGSSCNVSEVGPFMAGISQDCGNNGTCQLTDIMIVFHNVGNWILGLIGALVFLMYIYGGIMLLTGGASEENIKKGKQAIRISTVGLIIVFFAFAAITTLEYAVTGGNLGEEANTDQYVSCGPGSVNSGNACGFNKVCNDDGACIPVCWDQHPTATIGEVGGLSTLTWWDCIDVDNPPTGDADNGTVGIFAPSVGTCTVNLCPGADNIQCCELSAFTQ
jgi:hypothetical protein